MEDHLVPMQAERRERRQWAVLSVEMYEMVAVQCDGCYQGCGGSAGLLTHISIMLASISHIWPKF